MAKTLLSLYPRKQKIKIKNIKTQITGKKLVSLCLRISKNYIYFRDAFALPRPT